MSEVTPFPTPEPDPVPLKVLIARENGKKGGAPIGNTNGASSGHTLKSPLQQEKFIQKLSDTLLQGQDAIKVQPVLAPFSDREAKALYKATKMTVEEFNEALADKLGDFAEKALKKMEEKLADDKFKPNELSFALAIALDKRANLEGRNALKNANIAIQVNNYNGPKKTKEEMIKSLLGDGPVPEKNVTPV